jgi:hypothetical protein
MLLRLAPALLLLAAHADAPARQPKAVPGDGYVADPLAVRLGKVWLSGEDLLLIQTALRHPAMRGARLDCYNIRMGLHRGQRLVMFLGPGGIEDPPLPGCRHTSLAFDAGGEVVNVYHDLGEIDENLDDHRKELEAAFEGE